MYEPIVHIKVNGKSLCNCYFGPEVEFAAREAGVLLICQPDTKADAQVIVEFLKTRQIEAVIVESPCDQRDNPWADVDE